MVVPPKHPKMIIFSRKTHGCWYPPFKETPIYVHAYAVMLPIIMIQWKMAGHLKRHVFSLNRDYERNGTTPTGGLVFLESAQIFLAFLEPKQIQKAKPRSEKIPLTKSP